MDNLPTPRTAPYDYYTAAKSLNALIDRLQGAGAAAAARPDAPSQIATALRFWRGNWRSVFALLTLYSIPTAAVTALVFAERQKRSDQLWYEEQKRHLQAQMDGLRAGAARDRQLLRSFSSELQRLEGAWRLEPARARLLGLLRGGGGGGGGGALGPQDAPSATAGAAAAGASAAGGSGGEDVFALRPGPQGIGRGFII
ncbi:MAG: hypothetical protein J3K34DRAFT_212937 [Monoraphidium minutum]|nr:MAG: hypothetical protein J3K34DRAFT_212937 [Monoraphidium minutum]